MHGKWVGIEAPEPLLCCSILVFETVTLQCLACPRKHAQKRRFV